MSSGPGDDQGNTPGRRRGFWVAAVVGWSVIAYAAIGLLGEPQWAGNPGGFLRFYLSAAVIHDLVLVPAVLAVGWGLGRLVPSAHRAVVQAGLITSAVVAAYSWPYVRGYGYRSSNPSALPLDYGTNLALILGLIWGAVVLAVAGSVLARRRRRPQAG